MSAFVLLISGGCAVNLLSVIWPGSSIQVPGRAIRRNDLEETKEPKIPSDLPISVPVQKMESSNGEHRH